MATVGKLIRVANPRRKRIKVRRKRATGTKRRFRNRLGHFVKRKRAKARKNPRKRTATGKRRYTRRRKGSARKKSSSIVGMLRTELRRLGVSSNPRRRSKARNKRKSYRRRRVSNPVLIELGAINPRKKRSHMARRKRKYHRRRTTNPRRVARRRRNAPPAWAKAVGYRRRTTNRRRRRHVGNRRHRRHYSRRRNPAIFGHSGGKDLLMMSGGVLVGVALTKYLPTLIPASILSSVSSFGSASFMSVLVTGAGAFAAGFLAKKVSPGAFSDAVLLGGLAQTVSAALNAFAPPTLAGRLALSGVGDIIPGSYVVPQNPIKAGIIPMPAPSAGMGAFRGAFGGRR